MGSIKCETAHDPVECMDKTEVRLRRLLCDEVITLLLSHNELIDQGSSALGTHVVRLCSSTDPVPHASKQSGLGQMWMELQDFLQQNSCSNSFIYCEVEQELWCEESEDHPRNLEEKATGGGVTSGWYVKVQSAPYAYDQGAETKEDDPESAPLLWFFHPQIWDVARSGAIGRRILHLFLWIGKDSRSNKVKSVGFYTAMRASDLFKCELLYILHIPHREAPLWQR